MTEYQSRLPEPYHSLVLTAEEPFGHHDEVTKRHLKYWIERRKDQVVIEIGSLFGASTRTIANALPEHGRVYAIDPWTHDPRPTGAPWAESGWLFPCDVYQTFLSNMVHWEIAEKVVPVRMHSIEAAAALAVEPDLIFIDGHHTYQNVLQDITTWGGAWAAGPLICGHDWPIRPVQRAVRAAATRLRKMVNSDGAFWWLGERP